MRYFGYPLRDGYLLTVSENERVFFVQKTASRQAEFGIALADGKLGESAVNECAVFDKGKALRNMKLCQRDAVEKCRLSYPFQRL